MVNYLFLNYSEHALSLDVSTDNVNAIEFYKRVGLTVKELYLSETDQVEFAAMETELDKQGNKVPSQYERNLIAKNTTTGGNQQGQETKQMNGKTNEQTKSDKKKKKGSKSKAGASQSEIPRNTEESKPAIVNKVTSDEITKSSLNEGSLTESPLTKKECLTDVTDLATNIEQVELTEQ